MTTTRRSNAPPGRLALGTQGETLGVRTLQFKAPVDHRGDPAFVNQAADRPRVVEPQPAPPDPIDGRRRLHPAAVGSPGRRPRRPTSRAPGSDEHPSGIRARAIRWRKSSYPRGVPSPGGSRRRRGLRREWHIRLLGRHPDVVRRVHHGVWRA